MGWDSAAWEPSFKAGTGCSEHLKWHKAAGRRLTARSLLQVCKGSSEEPARQTEGGDGSGDSRSVGGLLADAVAAES